MSDFRIRYTEPFVTFADHQATGTTIRATVPRDGTPDDAPTPGDYLSASLGMCMLATIALVAKGKFELDMGDATVDVTEKFDDKSHRFLGFDLGFNLPIAVTERQRQSIERAAHACPVHKALHPDLNVTIAFNWLQVEDEAAV